MSGRASMPILLPLKPRILVVTLRRLGDVLLTTPLIRSLRRAWPEAEIDVLVFADTKGIIDGNPDINCVIDLPVRPSPADTLRMMGRLWKQYDLAISTQVGDRPTLFALIAGRTHAGLTAPDDTRFGARIKRRALHRTAPATRNIHRVEQLLALADALGIARVPETVCPAAAVPSGVSAGDRYAVIHVAPKFRYKQWTAEGWRALAAGLAERGLAVIALSGPDPAERRYLDDIWRGDVAIHQLTWPENVALLSRARVYIGPDTSVSHLAAAAGCPTVALFGPMDPRVWAPWPAGGLDRPWLASDTIQQRGNVFVVQNPLPCVPCTFEGCERHIGSESICLNELSAVQVLAAVDRALALKP
jgi:heptosyltransferase-3